MADPTNGDKAPAAGDATSQADTDTRDESQADTSTKAQAADDWQSTKKKLDRENHQLRREREDLAKKLKEFEDAKLSDVERLQKQVKDYEAKESQWAAERRERDARDAVIEAAGDEKIGARNPRAVYKLVKDDLEFDDKTGQIRNLPDVLKRAKAEYPELFGRSAGSVDGGSGSRAKGAGADMNAWLRGG